jgi:hypothetical protein
MPTLHTFGCSITQGFALPDVVKPILGSDGHPLTNQEIDQQGIKFDWTDIHILAPSDYAWPQVLADQLNMPLVNHARRGACFQQIARQCLVAADTIQPGDTVIVMWTYLSRLSLQWPARTSVPFANLIDTSAWRTVILGFNKLFGLDRSESAASDADQSIQDYIRDYTVSACVDPLGVYNRYYNSLVLQTATDGLLRASGARVIHLSVEPESSLAQLEEARLELDESLREPYVIPDPREWYTLPVDHDSCQVIHDPTIPPAHNDMHPSVEHHLRFARHLYGKYFT